MPKSRKAEGLEKVNPNCSFCGHHKDDVPLMVSSNVTKANCCSWCALGIVEQTFARAIGLEKQLKEILRPAPRVVPVKDMPDKVDVAVAKALKRGIT